MNRNDNFFSLRFVPLLSLAAITAVASSIAAPAQAPPAPATPEKDLLIFNNGDQLSGSLVRDVGDSIVFKSDMAGEITVPVAKIKQVKTHGEFAVLRHGASIQESSSLRPEPITITQDGVLLSPEKSGNLPPIPMKEVAYIVDADTYRKDLQHDPGFLHGWNGTATFGATVTQATQHGGTITAGAALVRQLPVLSYFTPRNKTTVDFQETYGILSTPALPDTDASQVKTSIFHADAERDEYFSKKGYYLGGVSFDHNFSQGLDLQQIYGGGIGYTPFSTPVHQLDLKADLHYEKQQFFDPSTNQNLTGSTFAEAYRRTLPMKIALTQSLSFIPAWNNLDVYSAAAVVGVVLPVYHRLGVNFTGTDNYLSNPSAGYHNNSFTFTSGITYTLR